MLTATLQREELKSVSTTAEEKRVTAQVHADCFLYPGKCVWLSKNPYLAYAWQEVTSPAWWRIVGSRPTLTPHLGLGSHLSLIQPW